MEITYNNNCIVDGEKDKVGYFYQSGLFPVSTGLSSKKRVWTTRDWDGCGIGNSGDAVRDHLSRPPLLLSLD